MNNTIILTGKLTDNLVLEYTYGQEQFYKTNISTVRHSGAIDILPLIISNTLLHDKVLDETICVKGELRSRSVIIDNKRKHEMYAFVTEFLPVKEDTINNIVLTGFICKEPILRTTPLGRDICDIMLAVNRLNGRADYVPCIAWGRNAKYASKLEVGTKVTITGRFQSRLYDKKLDDNSIKQMTAYEVSINYINIVTEGE